MRLVATFGGLYSCHQGWVTLGRGICLVLFEGLCFHMVEDSEARGRKKPWLHMGIFQGTHRVGIHSKKF
jgi:hypothetical protein